MKPCRNKLLWAFGAVLCLTSVVAGCSDLGAPLRLLPRAQLSSTSLDFGPVAVNGANSLPVRVGNTGEADLHGAASLACSEFSIASGGGAYTVSPGGYHDVVVRYAPSSVGPASCQLLLGEGLPVVTLTGTGLPTPVTLCVASVSALDFGSIAPGGNKLAFFTLYSRGTAPVDVDVATTCAEFTLIGGGGAHRIAPGDSLPVTLRFAPIANGTFACTVTTGAGNPIVTLNGSAGVPLCVASVSAVDFGSITERTSQSGSFKLYSRGSLPVDVDVASSCATFSVQGGGGAHTIAPGDSLLVSLQFTPGSGGNYSCNITTGAGNPVVTLSGIALAPSFAADIRPILQGQGCVNCHGWTRANQLVNIPSVSYFPAVLIAPGDLAGSVLYQKTANTRKFGGPMPQGTTGLSAALLLKIKNWILDGAPDN